MSLWKTDISDGVVVATYTNPPMNYFCAEGTKALWKLIDAWRDPSVRVVVLTGGMEGKFITHYSVEELVELAGNREAMRVAGTSLTAGYHEMLKKLRDLPKPVIVAMNGDTMGGGFELSLSCDIRIGQRGDYRFGLPEVKLGILPGGSGTQRLSRLIGAGRAIEFILRSRVVRPEEALALGLVHEVVDNALARAKEMAQEMANFPPIAVARAKHAVYTGSDTHLAAGLDIESSAFLETMLSEDGLLAMRTYINLPYEKRRDWLEHPTNPGYKGK
ncbi:MAG TPA: enoyl-CoA hydratase/isomerase family protein [Methylomirabilota bacterium]|jgi:enoyl-CoA hydratase|nr:enoyl-CoA hydratase/isomerase family protein [Methylomirabilota bacterium]